ncbi:hypothetical protein [Tenacibaculum maritimum]|uniref:hypothetical protein n=1 Tax=Tenacibaculum maritimum TaxID=107401 RepID=UPI0012E6E5CF|nr:hypothetical protein [Tenacibaculum maritimum]CAA0157811.1 conserved hypothetical protein [Tenacibaculum maritimum]
MKKNNFLETAKHKQTFYSTGNYCKKNNEIRISTEIPLITIPDTQEKYSLELKDCYDVSSEFIPCMLSVYKHGHPTYREKIVNESLNWDSQTLTLSSIFKCTDFSCEKILVITVHDEDFEDWHIDIYRFFVQHHVDFKTSNNEFECDMNLLQDFIGGKSVRALIEEEPRTIGGGVLDPA